MSGRTCFTSTPCSLEAASGSLLHRIVHIDLPQRHRDFLDAVTLTCLAVCLHTNHALYIYSYLFTSLYLSSYLSHSSCVAFCPALSVYLSVYQSMSIYPSRSTPIYIYVSTCSTLSVDVALSTYVSRSICLSSRSFCLSRSIYLGIHAATDLSISP